MDYSGADNTEASDVDGELIVGSRFQKRLMLPTCLYIIDEH